MFVVGDNGPCNQPGQYEHSIKKVAVCLAVGDGRRLQLSLGDTKVPSTYIGRPQILEKRPHLD